MNTAISGGLSIAPPIREMTQEERGHPQLEAQISELLTNMAKLTERVRELENIHKVEPRPTRE